MPEACFYLLASHDPRQRLVYACKLVEKIYRNQQSAYIVLDDPAQAADFDRLLWTFRPGSFVPHQLDDGKEPSLPQTVLIGCGDSIPASRQRLVVNLAGRVPAFGAATERVLEVVDDNEACKQAGRQRWRHYQELGWRLTAHKIQDG